MRRIYQLSMLCLAAGVVNACTPQEEFTSEDIPTAGVRFLNVVPDTGAVDMRAVDIVENTSFYNVGFRSTTLAFYKNARAGQRHFRVFMSVSSFSTLPAEQQIAIASTVLKDTTLTLEAGHRYTFILWGYARTGSSPGLKLSVFDDNPADPGTQVALRLVNAAVGRGAIDGRQYLSTGTAPATPTWAAVPEQTASAYVSTPTGTIKYNVTPAGSSTALLTDATAIAGAAATVDLDPLPGTTVAGSAVSGFVVPGSVIGSGADLFVSTTLAADSISVSAAASAYQRTAGSFVTQGFVVGDTITASGFTDAPNNGTSVVTAVTALSLTVAKVGGLVDQLKRPSRILRTPRPGIIFLWDRRPPRPAGI